MDTVAVESWAAKERVAELLSRQRKERKALYPDDLWDSIPLSHSDEAHVAEILEALGV